MRNRGFFMHNRGRYFVQQGSLASAGDADAPSVPGNLAASIITATSLTLTWDASTDNVGVTEYEVQQRLASGGNGDYVTIGTVAAPTVTLAVTGLANDTGYRFRVRARDAASNVSAWGPDDTGLLATTLWPFVVPSLSTAGNGIFLDGDGTGYFLAQGGVTTSTVTDSGGAVTVDGLCKLDVNGTVNRAWLPTVTAVSIGTRFCLVDTVNRWLYVAGSFSQINGNARNNICRFNLDTLALDSWNPNSSGPIYWMGLDSNRDVVVVGEFNGTIGGQTRQRIARLSRTTGLAGSFNPGCSGVVWWGIIEGNDLWVCGDWTTTVGGLTRPRIAKIDLTTGAADAAFDAGGSATANTQPQQMAKIGSNIYCTGYSALTLGGTLRPAVISISAATGAVNTGFNANVNGGTVIGGGVYAYDGKVLFTTQATNAGGAATSDYVILDPTTGLQTSPNLTFAGLASASPQGYQECVIVGKKLIALGGQTAANYTGTSVVGAGDRLFVLQLP